MGTDREVSPAAARERTAGAVAKMQEPLTRLVDSSRRNFANPYDRFDWPATVDPEGAWFFSPELSSLYGSELWDTLDEPAQRRVCFLEALNFFSLNIHGERELLQGLAARLYRPGLDEATPYLHALVDEENKHSLYFGTFCERYGRVYRSRKAVQATGSDALSTGAVGDLCFFAKVLLIEEIVDRFNLAQGKDERLHPLARHINQSHHADEARHLIFGRRLVAQLWEAHAPTFSDGQVEEIRRYLDRFFVTVWREYYNPDVYRDAGFDRPWDLADELWGLDAQRARRRAFTERGARVLVDCGLLKEEPHVVY